MSFSVPAFAAFRFTDGIYYVALVEVDGRVVEVVHDRNPRPGGRELTASVHIPIALLREVTT